MRLNLSRKLWLAFFCTLALCVLTMYLLLHNTLKRGFLDYTSQQAVQRLEILQEALINVHREDGSFTELTRDPQRWLELKSIIFPDRSPSALTNGHTEGAGTGKSPRDYYREFVTSISLYDADKNLLMGVPKADQTISWVPLIQEQATIGYLGFVKPGIVVREADRRFMAHILRVFGIISVVILVISLGVATFFARRISKPIVDLSEHTQALASGDYSRRIENQSRDEIGRLCRHFNQLAQTLQANEHSRAHWIADISHEMRTPVSVLQAQIEALQDGVRPLDRECLALLHRKVSGLSALVDDLFELTLSDIGALSYQKRELSLTQLVSNCVEHYRDKASAAGLALAATPPAGASISVYGDPKRLEQLVNNLLENSVRYTNAGGRIEVQLEQDANTATLRVRDSAPSVALQDRDKIFERLHRLEASRNRDTGGAGLGLAICKNIVAAHQGQIRAEDSPLGGLTLRVQLPKDGR
ncbi:ATP-binding protein [Marinimicrobium agarilyticum]|uniref:ATP-binding protein n=1 Tax=Marinimicrobium agarilyticum TaxID=306546 RepID=UPI0004005F7A|nr:ATP-binding protein [Marinimicrobium agarilyticum]